MNYAALCSLCATLLLAPLPLLASQATEPLALQRRLEPLAADQDAVQAARALAAQFPALKNSTLTPKAQPQGRNRVQQYRQEVAGIEVWGAGLAVLQDAQGKARVTASSLSTFSDSAALPAFALQPQQALQQALAALDLPVTPQQAKRAAGDAYLRIGLNGNSELRALRPARIRPVWYPAADRLIAAYYSEVLFARRGETRPQAEALLISAEDGRILRRNSQIHDLQPFSYRVFAGTDGHPYVDPYGHTNPHPTAQPDGYRPTVPAPMALLSLSHAGISSNDPWLADDAEETRGNNVDAFFNADTLFEGDCSGEGWGPGFNAEEGDFRPRTNGPRRFDYAYDANATLDDYVQCYEPDAPIPTGLASLNARVVQAFYAANWLHDVFYDAGYDEASGNMQADNYGRGGLDNDPLLVHGAHFSTFTYAPADGESGALSLGVNLQSRSNRDVSALDFGVLAHEWGHTLFGRLTQSSYYGQPGAINEGTADFIGLFLTVREQDRRARPGQPEFSGAYAVGAYMNLDYDYRPDDLPQAGSPGYPDNSYYHGIRRYPSSSDLALNPLTFRHIGLDNPVPAGSAPFDWKARSRSNAEIHTAGEVWTAALWQCARNVLAATPPAQFDSAHQRFLEWLVAGLKLFPVDATYTEARDAFLAAVRADSEADYRRCRSGFARRGMGAGAISPARDSFSLRGVRESYRDLENALDIIDLKLQEVTGDGDGVLDRNETGRLVVRLRNTGFSPLSRITLAVPPIPGFYDLPDRVYVDNVALPAGADTEISFDFRVRSRRGVLDLPVQAFAWDQQHPEAFAVASQTFATNYDLRRDSRTDSAAHAATFGADWSRGFEDPHGCALFICTGAEGDQLAEVLDWKRQRYNGQWAYVLGDPQLSLNSWLATQPFDVPAGATLELALRHDYDFERSPTSFGSGRIEIRLGEGPWLPAAAHVASGNWQFNGQSNGWRDDTVRFGPTVAGQRVQLRLRTTVASMFRENDAHWAVARVEIRGSAQPVFSSVHGDTQ